MPKGFYLRWAERCSGQTPNRFSRTMVDARFRCVAFRPHKALR